jgi:hypothetical protein
MECFFGGMADAATEDKDKAKYKAADALDNAVDIARYTHTHTRKQSKHIQTYKPIQYLKCPCLFLGCLKSVYST